MQMFDLNDLTVDTGYQQPRSIRAIERMAETFDPKLVGAILVNERDGQWFIVDGVVRVNAARLAGHNSLPATVLNVSRDEEISRFVEQNRRH